MVTMSLTKRQKLIKKRYRDKRALISRVWLVEQKFGRSCQDCKKQYSPCQLEFDHVPERGDKNFDIGQCRDYVNLNGTIRRTLDDEMNQCDLVCGNCHATRTLNRANAKIKTTNSKLIYIKNYKIENNTCNQCHNTFEWYQLQFNHLIPSNKSFQISRPVGKTLKDIKLEISKCEILCINCHAYKTHIG